MDSDSDFYGDEETVANLEARVASFDVKAFWKEQGLLGMAMPQRQAQPQPAPATLHNPYEGWPDAWQLTESIEQFLARLPPETTDVSEDIGWIWICNPFIRRRGKAFDDHQKAGRGEDEAPEEMGTQLALFKEGGTERLHMLTDFVNHAKKSGKAKTAISREVNQEREAAVQQIYALAQHLRVRTGKWMLFVEPKNVNVVWEIVARATAQNELGIAAKVAPRDGADSRRAHLICIYTYNFVDKDDVGRVLVRLRQLELVRTGGKPIYYKADALTHLGINSGNVWEFRASLYNSNEIFGYLKSKEH